MAEQNILTGDIKVLEQIISDVTEHQGKLSEQETLKQSIKVTSKEINTLEKAVEDEINQKVKVGEAAVCEGFNKALEADKEKLKEVNTEREKAKLVGVKERIGKETASLTAENEEYTNQIKATIDQSRLPAFCKNKMFYVLFYHRSMSDVVCSILIETIFFLVIPVVTFQLNLLTGWAIIAYYFIVAMLFINVKKIVMLTTVVKNKKILDDVSAIRDQMKLNQKKIAKKAKAIKNDKNDSVYGLEEFDSKIQEIKSDIKKIESEKEKALSDYDSNTKPNIIAEVNGRNSEKLNSLKTSLEKMTQDVENNDKLIKEQGIYISTNYEAYLGKGFTDPEKLEEIHSILQNEPAQTIAQALASYKNKA